MRGQVLVIFAFLLVILLGFTGVAIDIGRQNAEQRHIQTAADAAALAACRALIDGASDNAAAAEARTVADINMERSPSGTSGVIAPDIAKGYEDGHAGDPAYLRSGVIVSGTSVRVAISSTVDTTLARVVGIPTLDASARARCTLQGGPAVPSSRGAMKAPPARVAASPTSWPASPPAPPARSTPSIRGATADAPQPPRRRRDRRSSSTDPVPSRPTRANFRGFVALDVRNFESTTSRVYYNGVASGTNEQTLKNKEGAYLLSGYPGPMFPPVTNPADPDDQVAVLLGNDTNMVVHNFDDVYVVGDRLLLAIYSGTVMQIPDFAITPPSGLTLASTGGPVNGPNFTVTRNDAFSSTVTLHLHGDAAASAIGHAAWDILPDPPVSPPGAGDMNQPTWSTNVFIPAKNGTTVSTSGIRTNAVPAGIYTVWLEGHSGNPYFQTRRYPVPVKVGGAVRDFSLANSTTSATIAAMGGTAAIPIYTSTTSANATKWGATGSAVTLGVDAGSFTDCSLNAATIGAGQLTFSSSSVTPTSSGSGALSTLTINSVGLAPGCYRFNVRAYGTNGDGQPVVHIQPITFTVATSASSGSYVDVIGFGVFQITDINSNAISGRAVSGIYPDPTDQNLRRAQSARLRPW